MSDPSEPPDIAWAEWGGEGPRLVLAHANGFVPDCYRTLIGELRPNFRVATFAARPLWPGTVPTAVSSWLPLADDLARLLARRGETSVVGVGHSLGGVLTALAAGAEPDRFAAAVLLDPVVFSGSRSFVWGVMKRLGLGSRFPLARGARRRRDRWPDLESVRASWEGRAMFDGWDPRAVDDFLEASVTEAGDGGVELRYPKDWEARIFEICPHHLWPRLRRVEVPTLVVRGHDSDTLLAGAAARMGREMPDATVVELEGTSHFLPMERPRAVARLVAEFAAKAVRRSVLATLAAIGLAVTSAAAEEPWYVTGAVEITQPTELGHVIVLPGASLTARDVPEPGLRFTGHLWVVGDGSVRFERSVIQFMSVYHGQYSLAGVDDATVEIIACDYRVPNGVQHALFAVGNSRFEVEDTEFDDVQLLAGDDAVFEARRLDGNFEVLVQHDATMILADIPESPDAGSIWVWVEFPAGSEADYSPPLPGFVDHWTFPPSGAVGIRQRVTVDRCHALLWPMLVRGGSRVTLRDIPDEHWVVVGFHMPDDAVVVGLENGRSFDDLTLDLPDREFRVVNATIDTWNLYPQADAHVVVRDSVVGEILSLDDSRVWLERVTVDGSGGFLGSRDRSRMTAAASRITCTVEASQNSTLELHSSLVEPYDVDPTGAWTRFGAYDHGRLLADQTMVLTTPALAGRGLIAVSSFESPPAAPPGPGESVAVTGSVGLFSLDPAVAGGRWRLRVSARDGSPAEVLASGTAPVENGPLGTWSDADPRLDHRLQTILTDGLGRTLVGSVVVPGSAPRLR